MSALSIGPFTRRFELPEIMNVVERLLEALGGSPLRCTARHGTVPVPDWAYDRYRGSSQSSARVVAVGACRQAMSVHTAFSGQRGLWVRCYTVQGRRVRHE